MPRIAIGGLFHETHTFAPDRTSLAAFERQALYAGDAVLSQMRGTRTPIGGELEVLERVGYTPVPLLYAAAMPSGMVTAHAYTTLRDAFLARLRAVVPVDAVLLSLHGAMVAENEDDPEGDILQQVRAIVGPDCPVVSTLDMHGNLSPASVEAADVLVSYDTNPHLDTYERGVEAGDILGRMLEQGLRPTAAFDRPPLLLSALTTWTARPPLATVHARARELEADPRVVNVTVMGGFAYADTPYTGMSVVVTTDNDPALARRLARELCDLAWGEREAARFRGWPVEEAVRRALAQAAPRGPVILADVADNVGGGAPGDGTVILQALLDAGAQRAVAVINDPEAVAQARAAGVGGEIRLAVGGKADTFHGPAVPIVGVVERLTDGRFKTEGESHFAALYGQEVDMGPCAVARVGGVTLLLTTHKTPPGYLAQLTSQGIDPHSQQVIVVKSPVAFRGAYEPIAADIIEVDTPGLVTANLAQFTYHKLPRPVFPLDD